MKQLYVVSTGPGDPALLPPAARQALAHSSDIVAYGLYLSLLGDLVADKQQHHLALGQETERARLSLDLAAAGKTTALVSSGDVGIFAMATLVFELLDRAEQGLEPESAWSEVEIQVIPGISAMQAAAAKLGATLGHDFCAISLSDLLTPWAVIEKRIQAVASADFVISFYNPVSKKRRWQLAAAKTILMAHRSPETPVILGKNLTRENEQVSVITLAQLQVEDVDMLTLVQIGSSQTRCIQVGERQWVYTPRGYYA